MKIELLGTSFLLQSDEDREYLKKVVQYFEKKLDETRRTVDTSDPLKLAILAGMMITDEFFTSKKGSSELASDLTVNDLEEAEQITLNLIDTISQTLRENDPEPSGADET
ncbi:MAG: cell division protein ZapA [Salinispira sp.]